MAQSIDAISLVAKRWRSQSTPSRSSPSNGAVNRRHLARRQPMAQSIDAISLVAKQWRSQSTPIAALLVPL
jgi:uncharacterized protein YoaH (UPF0181 family)